MSRHRPLRERLFSYGLPDRPFAIILHTVSVYSASYIPRDRITYSAGLAALRCLNLPNLLPASSLASLNLW